MIDVQDCDARLPSAGDPSDCYLDELVRLSVILGRVQKAVYTPAGLNVATDQILSSILQDLEGWKEKLPDNLKFRGPDTPRNGGLLFMFYVSVNMLFWRVFMRISYACPSHLKFHLTVEKWTELVTLTGDAIDWLDANDRIYDIWLLVAYCAVSCALVQYHTWARRRDYDAQAKLKKLRDCVRKWEGSLSPDHMSARRKTAEIIALLYESTQGPQQPLEPPVLNPTGGVKVKPPTDKLVFNKDPHNPASGVFVAQESHDMFKDLPEGVIVVGKPDQPESQATSPSLVNFTPLGNMNPALNSGTNVQQVMNVLDAQPGYTLEQMTMSDSAILDGIPVSMFELGQWDTYFSRMVPNASAFAHPDTSSQPGGSQYHSAHQSYPPGSSGPSSSNI